MELAVDGHARPATGGRFIRVVDRVTEGVLIVALIGELALISLEIFARIFMDQSFLWTEEIARLSLSILAFVGGALAYRRGYHTMVAIFLNMFPPRLRAACVATSNMLVLAFALCLFGFAVSVLRSEWGRHTLTLDMPFGAFVIPLVVSLPLFAIYAVERLRPSSREALVAASCVVGIVALLATALRLKYLPWVGSEHAMYICLGTLFVTVFLGLPIAFALVIASSSFFWVTGSMPLVAIPQKMVADIGSFILLAIPFFIFAGLIMERGGLSLRLIEFGQAIIGHVRGGLHQVTIVSMYLVSGLSGSDSADVAAVGTVIRNMPESKQYTKEDGAAVLAASAVMGSTVPPSIAMLLLGSITQISIASLFIGGFLPAAAMAVCLMILVYAKARRANLPRAPRASIWKMLAAAQGAVLPLTMPLILFGGILTGTATPTEVSAFAVLYGIVISMFVYRFLDFRGLIRAAIDSALLTGLILFILACASTFSWALTVGYLPQRLVGIVQSIGGDSSTVFLIGSILLLIVTGSLLEGLPALNILAPMLVPMAPQFGLSQLHYGMVLLISMGVGVFMPPTGVGFYIACSVMRTDIEPAARAMIPYFIFIVIGLLIVAFVPWLTVSLPIAFGFRG